MAESSDGLPLSFDSRRKECIPHTSSGTIVKICGVCGDHAKSYHFGGISCDSCKAFFRRSVQSDAHHNFQCPYENSCEISMTSRKCCQFCRFQKCISIGMEKTWVMTEEERLQLLRQRLERRSHQQDKIFIVNNSQCQAVLSDQNMPNIDSLTLYLNSNEMQLIENITNIYEQSACDLSHPPCLVNRPNAKCTNVDLISMFSINIRRYANFARQLDAFHKLPSNDQCILLRAGMLEMCVIGGVSAYKQTSRIWPPPNLESAIPQLWSDGARTEDISKLVSPETYAMHVRFSNGLRELCGDETTLLLLLLTALFSPDRPGLESVAAIENEQTIWLHVLRKYLSWRFGEPTACTLYPKLLLKLPDLRELNDAHAKHTLQLDQEELLQIQGRLGNLKLVDPETTPLPPCLRNVLPSSMHLPCMLRTALPYVASPLPTETTYDLEL